MHEDERRMYELEYPAPAVSNGVGEETGPTLIVALHGYADAGHAVEASADYLKAALENRQLASFNNDELIDYRSRRPATTINTDGSTDIEPTELGIKVMRDSNGRSFLLLSGPEPDMRWEAFSEAVTNLARKFGVKDTIMLYAAPMPVPHTRPVVVTAHGNAKDLKRNMIALDSTIVVPGSAALFLEQELVKDERNVAGYLVHVPHYLASSPYPPAIHDLLAAVSKTTGLSIPLGSIEGDIERVNRQLREQVMDSEEIAGVVSQLEEQYDAYMERYRANHPQAIMPGEQDVPSGEVLGAEFQAFLEGLSGDPEQRDEYLRSDIDDREDGSDPDLGDDD